MYYIHQYDEKADIQVVDQAADETQAAKKCAHVEDEWGERPYGAAFYTLNGAIVGDREGPREPAECEPHWSRCGGVMHGREW